MSTSFHIMHVLSRLIGTSHSRPEQVELLHNAQSRRIIQKVADDTSTLRASMSATASHSSQTPTILSHDDSTIDGRIFDWDDEIVNAASYRRALNHARSKAEIPSRPSEREDRLETISQAETEESNDRLTPIDGPSPSPRQKPLPYEMSVASEPVDVHGYRSRVALPISSQSDSGQQRRNVLTHRLKTPDADKKSFWSSLSGKRSSLSLAPPHEPTTRPDFSGSRSPASGSRRGRRGFENSFHTSIDFGSEDGLSAPPIVRAAQAGSVVEVEMLLDQRADINAQHVQSGRNALAVASHCGNEEVVRLLLQYGAAVNGQDATSMTPLHLASLRGHCGVVELLLQERADIDAKGPNDQTPLRIAAEKGQIELVQLLLRKRARVNARDMKQMTALHVAARQGDEAMAELLVSHGAHVEAKDGDFMNATHYACEGGHDRVLACLLNKKADIEAPGKASMTPLLCASSAGHAHIVELLIKKHASLKHKGEGDMTALHWASYNGHEEVLDILIQKRAPISAGNKDGRTPLHLAVMAEKFAAAELLLRKGAPIEVQCRSMLRPLHYACVDANPEITRLLLGYNANIEAEDGSGKRPLHTACIRGSLPLVDLLLQRGVNIEARNADGDRPLSLASSSGHVEIVQTLLNRGAALRLKYSSGPSHEDSPLCVAAKGGHLPVVQELLMRGASALQKDERNWQPLRYAAFYAHPEVVEILLRHGASVSGSASGGWGFNVTAHRIGFADNVSNEEQRKGQVLRLLTSAEAREQQAQERIVVAGAPLVPPAVQNQTSPTELPNGNIPSPPAQNPRPPPPSLPPRAPTELASHSPAGAAPPPGRYTFYQAQPPVLPGVAQAPPQPAQQPSSGQDQQQTYTNASPMPFVSPMPSEQSFTPSGYSNYTPSPMPSTMTPQPSSALPYSAGASSTGPQFVPKTMPQQMPPSGYNPAGYTYNPGGRPMRYAPPPDSMGHASTMTLGPDGLWQPVNAGVQRSASQRSYAPPSEPPNYPAGVYEMAS